MSIVAVIQARMSSTRLPGKVGLLLEGKTVLEHVINRVKQAKNINSVIVATTNNPEDQILVKLCESLNTPVFCGSLNDVLDRFYQAVNPITPDHIIRITADCPVLDPKIIDNVIDHHLKTKADYTSNVSKNPTYPDGEDVEIFTFKTLKNAWKKAKLASEREHVTMYIRNNSADFKIEYIDNNIDLSQKRWTLDNQEDFNFIKCLYQKLYSKNKYFGLSEILNLLEKNPDLESINSHLKRNEGYQKSLKEDYVITKEK
jgi:spore coat polysaccharide biosynthesis protein SpsF